MTGNDRDDMIRRRRPQGNEGRRREELGNDVSRMIGRSASQPDAERRPDGRYERRTDASAPARRRRSEVLGAEPESREAAARRRSAQGQRPAQDRRSVSDQRAAQGQRSAQNRGSAQGQRPAQDRRPAQGQRPAPEYRRAQDYGSDAERLASRRPAGQTGRSRQAARPAPEISYDPIDRDEIARIMEEDERRRAGMRQRSAAAPQPRRTREEREYFNDRGSYTDTQDYGWEEDYYAGRGRAGHDVYDSYDEYDEDDLGTSYTGRSRTRAASYRDARPTRETAGRRGDRRGYDGGRGGRGGNDGYDNGGRRRKKKSRAPKVILAIVIILAILIVGGIVAFKVWFSRGYQGEANVLTNNIDPNYDVWDDYLSILVLGADGTEGDANGGDVDILVNVNRDTGEIRMLSFYRDLYLADETGYTDKLTNIFRHGDSISVINALNMNYDLRINEYVAMGWDNVSEAIDLLGGVEVNVPAEMIVDLNGYIENTALAVGVEPVYVTEAGPQNLTGIQAVSYCRIRYTDVPGYSSGDFGRSERQREVLSALFQKAKSGSPLRLMNAARAIWPKIQTSLSMNEVLGLIPVLRTMNLGNTAGFPRNDGEVDHRMVGRAFGASVVYSSDTLSDISWIYEYLFGLPGYEPTDQARQFAAVVASETS